MQKSVWRGIGAGLAAIWFALGCMPAVQNTLAMPRNIDMYQGERLTMDTGWLQVTDERGEAVMGARGDRLTGNTAYVDGNSSSLMVSLFGLSLGRVAVRVNPTREVILGGNCVGVGLAMRGVLVVGVAEVMGADGVWHSPAVEGGLIAGDEIEAVDDTIIDSAPQFLQLVEQSDGNPLRLTVRRGRNHKSLVVQPAADAQGIWRMGAWVRDSTAGIGTLTYIDPEHNTFGALGHAIGDPDLGQTLSVGTGKVVLADVTDIVRGQAGVPGEIRGDFVLSNEVVGDINANNDFGIFGGVVTVTTGRRVAIASRGAVRTGAAQIVATIDDSGPQTFDIQITRVTRQSVAQTKSIVLEVTDPRLLEKTGGIVQGMSGSPILQDGKLIGAVTHVFVNDPTKGYGVFIEWMLDRSDEAA